MMKGEKNSVQINFVEWVCFLTHNKALMMWWVGLIQVLSVHQLQEVS